MLWAEIRVHGCVQSQLPSWFSFNAPGELVGIDSDFPVLKTLWSWATHPTTHNLYSDTLSGTSLVHFSLCLVARVQLKMTTNDPSISLFSVTIPKCLSLGIPKGGYLACSLRGWKSRVGWPHPFVPHCSWLYLDMGDIIIAKGVFGKEKSHSKTRTQRESAASSPI